MRNNHELTTLRNRALWNDFYRTRNEWFDKHLIFTKRQLLTHVLNNCRPHYYVTFDYAARQASRLIRSKRSGRRLSVKQQMWYEIASKVARLMLMGRARSISQALTEVLVSSRASRYFLSYSQARRIINEESRRHSARRRC